MIGRETIPAQDAKSLFTIKLADHRRISEDARLPIRPAICITVDRVMRITGAATFIGILCLSFAFANESDKQVLQPSCMPEEFQLFKCETNSGEAVSLCVTHELNLYFMQNTFRHTSFRDRVTAAEESINAMSAHSSLVVLRLLMGERKKTIFAQFSSFEQDPVAITTDNIDGTEYCDINTTAFGQEMVKVNGKDRFLRVQNLLRLGMAVTLKYPPSYPVLDRQTSHH